MRNEHLNSCNQAVYLNSQVSCTWQNEHYEPPEALLFPEQPQLKAQLKCPVGVTSELPGFQVVTKVDSIHPLIYTEAKAYAAVAVINAL